MSRLRPALLALFAIACAGLSALLGNTYISRLPQHDGYFLVPVQDRVAAPLPRPPRHAIVIVVDGLRRDAAESMTSVGRIAAQGHCRVADQGTYTVSRPEYALLSTGLEVDRSGARNNDLAAPLAAESVWEVAREHGLRVGGSSHLPWFRELFPRGFDRYHVADSLDDDVFAVPALADVDVFHPVYVDEVAHEHGAASESYRAAVARVDRELGRLLDERVDFSQDVVIFTADHGHRDAGGHGGAQPEIRYVLSCFGGLHVARLSGRRSFDARSTAPLLSLLLGLRFPRHMHALDDALDELWSATDFGAEEASYLGDRRAAVERFRSQNRLALERWLGGPPGSWARLYEREKNRQAARIFGLSTVVAVLLGLYFYAMKRAHGARAAGASLLFIALAFLAIYIVHRAVLGELDYSVLNLRARFIPRALTVAALAEGLCVLGHVLCIRDRARFRSDAAMLLVLLFAINTGHVLVYGWPLGFPLPPASARYLPFFAVFPLLLQAGVVLVAVIEASFRRKGRDTATGSDKS